MINNALIFVCSSNRWSFIYPFVYLLSVILNTVFLRGRTLLMTWVKLDFFLIPTSQATAEIVSWSHALMITNSLNLYFRNMNVGIIEIVIIENCALEDNPCWLSVSCTLLFVCGFPFCVHFVYGCQFFTTVSLLLPATCSCLQFSVFTGRFAAKFISENKK